MKLLLLLCFLKEVRMSNKMCVLVTAIAIAFAGAQCAWAQTNGTWLVTAANPFDWSTAANWVDGNIADGDSATASFSTDIVAGGVVAINVDALRDGLLIGHLYFYDTDTALAGSYLIKSDTLPTPTTLNLSNVGYTSLISVESQIIDPPSPPSSLTAEISAPIVVADGTNLSITGGGILKLSGNTTVTNGTASISGVTLYLPGSMTLNNGAATIDTSTVDVSGSLTLTSGNATIGSTSGSTSTVNVGGTMTLSSGNATISDGSTVNVSGSVMLNNGNATIDNSTLNVTGTGTFTTSNTITPTLGQTNINSGSTANLSGTAALTSNGSSYNGGTLNVGLPNTNPLLPSTDAVTVTLKGGDNAGNGIPALGAGGGSDIATINVRGTSTISTIGAIRDEVQLGTWGTAAKGILNMYDSSVLNTGQLTVVKYAGAADANFYNNSKVNATNVDLGDYAAGAVGNINMHDNSTLTVTGTCWVSQNQGSGATATSNLNMYENSVANVNQLSVIRYGNGNAGNVNLYNNAKLYATGVIMSEYALAGTGVVNLHDNSTLTVTNTFLMGAAQPSGTPCTATLNMDSSSVLSATQLTVVRYDASVATVNVKGNAQENATTVVMNDFSSGGTGIFNMYDTSTVTATNFYVMTNKGSGTASTSTVNMYNNSVMNVSGTMTVVRWGFASQGNVNLNDSAQVNVGTLLMCDYMDPTWTGCVSKFTLNNSSKLYVTADASVGANQGSSTMTVNDTAEVHVTGTLYSARSNRATGIPNYGEVDVNGSGKIFATNITMGGGGNAAPNNATSLWNITDNGAVSASGNLSMGGGTSIATLNVKKSAQFSVGGDVSVGDTAGGVGTISVTENASFAVAGATTLTDGSTIMLDSTGTLSLKAVTGGVTDSLVVGDGNTGATHYAATAHVDSVSIGTVTIGAGSTLVIDAIPGGPTAGGGLTAVPEPSTLVLLAMAAIGLIGAAWRRRNS
jgi:hypothetical protein